MEKVKEILFEWDITKAMSLGAGAFILYLIITLGMIDFIITVLQALIWQMAAVVFLFFAGWLFSKLKH